MKHCIYIIICALGLQTAQAQWALRFESLYDHTADSSGLELAFAQFEQKSLSNAHLGNWSGMERVEHSQSVFAMNEHTNDLINLRFHRRYWQYGMSTTLYNLNTRTLSPSLFNVLYLGEDAGNGSYSYYSMSSLKHSISVGRKLGGIGELTLILNGHQLNSFAELNYMGQLSQAQDELHANFSGEYHSYNADYTDTARTIAVLPQSIYATDSGHYSIYKYGELKPTYGFYLKLHLGTKIDLAVFGNHLGAASEITTKRQNNSYALDLSTSTIQTIDLINASTDPFIQPNGNYSYSETRKEKGDSTFSSILQPQVTGASLTFKMKPTLELLASTSTTKYPSFDNHRYSLLLRKYFADSYLLGGLLYEDRNNTEDYYNLVLGAQYSVAPRLQIKCYSNTAINYNYLNQKIAPIGTARMQFMIGAEITLP
jgi:hypothetical protein